MLELVKFLIGRKEFAANTRSNLISSLAIKKCYEIYKVIQFLNENGGLDNKKNQIISKAWKEECFAILEYFDGRQELGTINDDLIVDAILNGNLNVIDFLEKIDRISSTSVDKAFLTISRSDNVVDLSIMKRLVKTGKFSVDSMNQAFINTCKCFANVSCDNEGNCNYIGSNNDQLITTLQCLEETGVILDETRSEVFFDAVLDNQRAPVSFFLEGRKLSRLIINQAIEAATSLKNLDMMHL